MRTVVAPNAALLHFVLHFTPHPCSLSHPYSECKESHHPSLSDCLTRSSIADTKLCHPEQSLFSDRKASRPTAPQRLEREELVGEEARRRCQRDLSPALTDRFFSRWADGFFPFFTSSSTVPARSEKTECYFNSL